MDFASSSRRMLAPEVRSARKSGPGATLLLPVVLLAAILLFLLAEVHALREVRTLLIYAGAVLGIAAPVAWIRPLPHSGKDLREGPGLPALGLLVWSLAGVFLAEHRAFATADLLRVGAGVAVFCVVAHFLESMAQVRQTLAGAVVLAVGFALADFAQVGRESGLVEGLRTGFFATHEEVGTLMLLLCPVALALAASPSVGERWRLGGFTAALVLSIALLLSRCRSAWIAAVPTLLVLVFCQLRFAPESPRGRDPRSRAVRALTSPVALIVIGLSVFVGVTGAATLLARRAGTFAQIFDDRVATSIGNRLAKWNGASLMLAERPVTGWGPGAYLVTQGRWTHQGDDAFEVLTGGTGHQNIAHNYYLQWAADTGAVGLALHVATLATFLLYGFSALPRLRGRPQDLALLVGCLGATVGAAVDAVGSPSYNFHGLSSVLWLLMGAGTAVARTAPAPRPRRAVLGGLGIGVLAAVLVLGVSREQVRAGRARPRGTLAVTATPPGPIPPGGTVRWTATFTEADGTPVATMPGTLWTVEADDFVLRSGTAQPVRVDPEAGSAAPSRAALETTIPATQNPVTVRATWIDRAGRRHTAAASVRSAPGKLSK